MRNRRTSKNNLLKEILIKEDAELVGLEESVGHDCLIEVLGLGLRDLFMMKGKTYSIHNVMKMLRETCSLVHSNSRYFERYGKLCSKSYDCVVNHFEDYYHQTKSHRQKTLSHDPTDLLMLSVLAKFLPVIIFVFVEELPSDIHGELKKNVMNFPLIYISFLDRLNNSTLDEDDRVFYLTKVEKVIQLYRRGEALILNFNNGDWSVLQPRKTPTRSSEFLKIGSEFFSFLDRCDFELRQYRSQNANKIFNGWDSKLNMSVCKICVDSCIQQDCTYYKYLDDIKIDIYNSCENWNYPYLHSDELLKFNKSSECHGLFGSDEDLEEDEDNALSVDKCINEKTRVDRTQSDRDIRSTGSSSYYEDRTGSKIDYSRNSLVFDKYELEKEIFNLTTKRNRINRRLTFLNVQNDQALRLNKKYVKERDEVRDEIDVARRELEEVKNCVAKDKLQIADVNNDCARVRKHLDELRRTRTRLENEIQSLENKKATLAADFVVYGQCLNNLKDKSEAQTTGHKRVRSESKEVDLKRIKIDNEVTNTLSNMTTFVEESSRITAEFQSFEDRFKNVDNNTNALALLEAKVKALEDKLMETDKIEVDKIIVASNISSKPDVESIEIVNKDEELVEED